MTFLRSSSQKVPQNRVVLIVRVSSRCSTRDESVSWLYQFVPSSDMGISGFQIFTKMNMKNKSCIVYLFFPSMRSVGSKLVKKTNSMSKILVGNILFLQTLHPLKFLSGISRQEMCWGIDIYTLKRDSISVKYRLCFEYSRTVFYLFKWRIN